MCNRKLLVVLHDEFCCFIVVDLSSSVVHKIHQHGVIFVAVLGLHTLSVSF